MTLAGVVVALVVVAVVAALLVVLRVPSPDRPAWVVGARAARALRLLAVAVTVAVGAALVAPAWRDSGAFALVLVGVPVAAAVVVLGAELAARSATAATWVAAAVMLVWSLLTGLGLGLHFLGPSVLMALAAVVSTPGRRDRGAGATPVAGGRAGRRR